MVPFYASQPYLSTNELIRFLYKANRAYARFASHSIGLSVLAFSTISHSLVPTTT